MPAAALLLVSTLSLAAAPAALAEGGDRTLAPYFQGDGPLPLEETRADAAIAGPIARVRVHQVFRNAGDRPIEAVYVFPASTRAAVHGLRMRIGDRTVEARIARRGEARAEYEAGRDAGRRAALLEQERPNVFTVRVANVLPGERIAVDLEYSELLVPEDGVYELVHPAVVGPRYGGGADPAADRWIASPYLGEGVPAPYRFGFAARIDSALPLRDVSSPSHAIDVRLESPTAAAVALRGEGGGDRDVILRWRLAGDGVEAGAMLAPREGGDGGWFVVALEPPARAPVGAAALAREYVFLVDVSGSMHGFPLETAKALMRDLLGRLGPQDLLNVVLFAGGSEVLAPEGSLPASPENVARAIALVERQRGGGGTELVAGLRAAYGVPRAPGPRARSVIVVTDGFVGVEAQAFRLVRERLPEASLFSFGIGGSVNRHLVEGLARAGAGEPFVVLSPARAAEAARRFREYVERPVLTGVEVRFEGLDARQVLPARVPDVFARRPVVLVGEYRGAPRGRISVEGRAGGGPWRASVEIGPEAVRPGAPLRTLWARRRVEHLDDERSLAPAAGLDEAIAELGLAHSLLTAFTSFVAVDSQVAHRGGRPEEILQPLPLPSGVSSLAVGGVHRQSKALLRAPSAAPAAEAFAPTAGRADAAGRAEPAAPEARAAARILRVEAPGLDAGGLRRALELRLRELRPARGGALLLRLTVNEAGVVARVERVRGDPELARAVERLLAGLALAGRPAAAPAVATVELELPGRP
jgi:Ca-activated chloride channel family protein